MFPNVGLGEFALIFFVLLMAVGPKRLPEIAKSLGKAFQTFQTETRKAQAALREVIDEPMSTVKDAKSTVAGVRGDLESSVGETKAMFKDAGATLTPEPDATQVKRAGAPVDPHDPKAAPVSRSPGASGSSPVTASETAETARPATTQEEPESLPALPIVRDYEDT